MIMKKELNYLLEASNSTKQLRINGAFRVDSVPVDKFGYSIEIWGTKLDHMELTLLYTLAHDKCLFRSRKLNSRTADELKDEIASAMEEVMDYNKNEMLKTFCNGCLC